MTVQGWPEVRIRFVGRLNPSKSEVSSLPGDTEVTFLPMDAIGDDGSIRLDTTRSLAAVDQGYTYFRNGDVAIAKITPCFENGKGALMSGLLGGIGFGTTELIVVRPDQRRITGQFLQWLFISPHFRNMAEAAMYGAGGQKRVPDDFVRDFALLLPTLAEQSAIAAFLDRETGKIDALVAEQERLIALLKEKRQAAISHAVTKGLNPDIPMKDSGVAWLGEVPTHWEVIPLMWLTQPSRPIMYGIVLPGPDIEEGVPILKGGNVKPSRMNLHSMARTTPEIEAPYARARLVANDLVYSIRGSIGDCEIVPPLLEGSNITQDVARVAPDCNIDSEWLRFSLLAKPLQEELACGSLGAAVRGINIFDLKRVRVPVPPSVERDRITNYLRKCIDRLQQLSPNNSSDRPKSAQATKQLGQRFHCKKLHQTAHSHSCERYQRLGFDRAFLVNNAG